MIDSPGVIFDMDGVLVHSNPAHKKALKIFLERYKLSISEERLKNRLYGRTNKEWIPEIFEFSASDSERISKLAHEKEKIFRDLFNPSEQIVPGLYKFLEHLKTEDIPMAVATSAPRANADFVLSSLEIEHFFDVVIDSSHVETGKPDPEVYYKTSKALGKKALDCVVFEDSISGVKAGLDSGAKVVGVMTTHTSDELEGCHLVIQDFNDLKLEDLLQLNSVSS